MKCHKCKKPMDSGRSIRTSHKNNKQHVVCVNCYGKIKGNDKRNK